MRKWPKFNSNFRCQVQEATVHKLFVAWRLCVQTCALLLQISFKWGIKSLKTFLSFRKAFSTFNRPIPGKKLITQFVSKEQEAAACHVWSRESKAVVEIYSEIMISLDVIRHGSKRGNKFHTSFSYTRCSVQSRIWTLRRTAPSRTEVTGLNWSDHANWPRGEPWRFYPTRIQIRLRETHYVVTPLWEPTNIATRRRKERRREEN